MADKRITDVDFVESLNSDESFFINQNNTIKQIKRSDVVFNINNGGTGATDAATAREKLEITPDNIGAAPADNGIQTYAHLSDSLIGTGTNGKFKATSNGVYTSFLINNVSCLVKCGEENEIELIKDCWYTFILDENTINFNQGDAGFNFKILGGTTQPASPRENTIWINTDVPIGEWQFSAIEPPSRIDGTSLQNGDVWLPILNTCKPTFNIHKKNGVPMAIAPCKLYIDGNWCACNESRYIDNKWSPPTAILFDETYNTFHLADNDDVMRVVMNGWIQTNHPETYAIITFDNKEMEDFTGRIYEMNSSSYSLNNKEGLKASHAYRYVPFDISVYNKMYIEVVDNKIYGNEEQPWVFNLYSTPSFDSSINRIYYYEGEVGVKSINFNTKNTDNMILNVGGPASLSAGYGTSSISVRSIWFTKEGD